MEIKYLQVVGRPSTDEGRRSEFVGAVTDITNHGERKNRAEERAYLADAQKLSQTGSWAWSPEVGIKYWSEECYRVQGFDPRDGLPRFEELFQRMHPDWNANQPSKHARFADDRSRKMGDAFVVSLISVS